MLSQRHDGTTKLHAHQTVDSISFPRCTHQAMVLTTQYLLVFSFKARVIDHLVNKSKTKITDVSLYFAPYIFENWCLFGCFCSKKEKARKNCNENVYLRFRQSGQYRILTFLLPSGRLDTGKLVSKMEWTGK